MYMYNFSFPLVDLSNLQVLDLCYNEMTVKTGRKLSTTLKSRHHLTSVRVNGNEFGSCAETLFDFLQEWVEKSDEENSNA